MVSLRVVSPLSCVSCNLVFVSEMFCIYFSYTYLVSLPISVPCSPLVCHLPFLDLTVPSLSYFCFVSSLHSCHCLVTFSKIHNRMLG